MVLVCSTALIASTLATQSTIGCKNCLDDSKDDIRYGCFQNCHIAFNPSSSEYQACRDGCTEFVFEEHCCTSESCSSDANTCMATFFTPPKRSRRLDRRLKSMSLVHDPDIPSMEPGALIIRDGTTHLEVRVDPGKACCIAAQTILSQGGARVLPLITGQIWSDDTAAGLVLVAFGLASGWACKTVYGESCMFAAPGLNAPLANGPIGAPPPPPAPPP
ncbi:hypothetical protein EV356DRAFT_571148 [Viridothelium virens]|uniref:Extracellular membrane protein CFEM domain-containing protein n=1 Tax=Viridothelium virens TaxID=1048519 RepID=A0A6A6GUV5_VIRVR|nr:hypothetical protein EV356DRAFT_571148 [Viridothelium virens]